MTPSPRVCTFSQRGWGASCGSNNADAGCIRDANFATAFPSGLLIGGGFRRARWTTSPAIERYLPAYGWPSALIGIRRNPTRTAAGTLASQQVAAKLNVVILGAPSTYVFTGCVSRNLIGTSVGDVIAMADEAMASGHPPFGMSFHELSDALGTFNENYDQCTNRGCLAPSVREVPQPTPGTRPIGPRSPLIPRR